MAECKHAASERAMKAAVDMEIHAACSTTTVGKALALDRHFPAYDEMLAALKATLADFAAWCEIRGGAGTYQPAMDRVQAAISKAEGRSHD